MPARGSSKEQRVEQDVRRPEVRGAAAGHEERDRDGGVHTEVMLRDRVRRSFPHGDDVDERNHEGDEDDPGQPFEQPQERPAREHGRPKLREVRCEPEVCDRAHERDEREHDHGDEEPPPVPQGKGDQDERQRPRDDRDGDEHDCGPEPDAPEVRRDQEPGAHRDADSDERRDARAR